MDLCTSLGQKIDMFQYFHEKQLLSFDNEQIINSHET